METIIERKCSHDRGVSMTRCKGEVEVTVRFMIKVTGEFNGNYKSGREVLEQIAHDEAVDLMPRKCGELEIEVDCGDYEVLGEEEPDND